MRIENRLPASHPRRDALDRAIREALAGLPGPWDVSIDLDDGSFWTIAVVAPDGSRWTMACTGPDHLIFELTAERVRTACGLRRQRLEKEEAMMAKTKRKAPDGAGAVGAPKRSEPA